MNHSENAVLWLRIWNDKPKIIFKSIILMYLLNDEVLSVLFIDIESFIFTIYGNYLV